METWSHSVEGCALTQPSSYKAVPLPSPEPHARQDKRSPQEARLVYTNHCKAKHPAGWCSWSCHFLADTWMLLCHGSQSRRITDHKDLVYTHRAARENS